MDRRKMGTLFVLLSAMFFSLGGLGFKLIEGWNALSINCCRTAIGSLMILLFIKVSGRKLLFNRQVLLGALCVSGTNFLYAIANKLTTAANTIVLQFTAPIFVILLCWMLFGKKPKRLDVIACIIVFAGVLCFVMDSLEMGGMLGNILALISGLTYAGVFMLNEIPGGDSLSSVFWGLLVGVFVGIPFLLQETQFAPVTFATLAVLGVVQIGFAYTFLVLGTKYTPPVTASLISGVEPILNPVLVAIFYPSEKVGAMAIIGTIIVVVGIVGYNVLKEAHNNKQKINKGEL